MTESPQPHQSKTTVPVKRQIAFDGAAKIWAVVYGDKLPEGADWATVLNFYHQPHCTTWIHIRAEDRELGERLLREDLGFHPVAAEDAMTDDERPELKTFDDHLFFVLPAVLNRGQDEEFVEVAFFLRGNNLVTAATEEVPVLIQWHERLVDKAWQVSPSAPFLMHTIADAIVDDYFPAIDLIEEQVDRATDETISEEGQGTMPKLIAIKSRMMAIRRRLSPMREVFNSLQRRDIEMIPNDMRPYLQDLYTNSMRLMEDLDTNRDNLSSLFDLGLSLTNNRLGHIVERMTVISTVLMLCALIAGIYGMNFQHMPELGWLYGYPFALGLMVVGSIATLILFKRKGWL